MHLEELARPDLTGRYELGAMLPAKGTVRCNAEGHKSQPKRPEGNLAVSISSSDVACVSGSSCKWSNTAPRSRTSNRAPQPGSVLV